MIFLGRKSDYSEGEIEYYMESDIYYYFTDDKLALEYETKIQNVDICYISQYGIKYLGNLGDECKGEKIIIVPEGVNVPEFSEYNYKVISKKEKMI